MKSVIKNEQKRMKSKLLQKQWECKMKNNTHGKLNTCDVRVKKKYCIHIMRLILLTSSNELNPTWQGKNLMFRTLKNILSDV